MLTDSGGIRCDLTIARKGEELFRVVTGGGSGQHDLAWMRRQIGAHERVRITERTGSLFALGLWGPRAREILGAVTDADLGNDAFPYMTARYLHVGEVGPVWAQRISYAGELGWELYGQFAMGDRTWDLLWEAGREHGLVAAGLGAFDTLRLEKGYRLWGQDIDTEHDPFEAGLGFAVKMDKGEFQGREALAAVARGRPDARSSRASPSTTPPRSCWARSRSGPADASSGTRRPPGTGTRSGAASSTVTCPSSWRCRGRRSRSSTSTNGFRQRSPRTRCGTRRAND